MTTRTTADELIPLIAHLSQPERLRLVRPIVQTLTLTDAEAYTIVPVAADKFVFEDDGLSWESEGWESLD